MNGRPSEDPRAIVLTALLLVVVFVAGGLVGAATLSSLHAAGPDPDVSTSPADPLAELGLSADQRLAVEGILDSYRPAADSLVRASIASLRSLMDRADAEVRAVLSPDQIAAYESMVRQQMQIRAVRRVMGPDGPVVDTIR